MEISGYLIDGVFHPSGCDCSSCHDSNLWYRHFETVDVLEGSLSPHGTFVPSADDLARYTCSESSLEVDQNHVAPTCGLSTRPNRSRK